MKEDIFSHKGATISAATRTMSGQFTFAKSDAPGSSSTTMFKTRDSTGNFVSYLSGMELLAADTEDGASFRGQLLKVG